VCSKFDVIRQTRAKAGSRNKSGVEAGSWMRQKRNRERATSQSKRQLRTRKTSKTDTKRDAAETNTEKGDIQGKTRTEEK